MQLKSLVEKLDFRYLLEMLQELAKVPAAVPMGTEVFMEPDNPVLIHYVQNELRPRLLKIGVDNLIDVPKNQIVAKYGKGTSENVFLVQVYTPVQHHNLMSDPWSGKIENAGKWGYEEPCLFGQGVTQNKSHQAIILTILKAFIDHKLILDGHLYIAINNEGRSSHACTESILEALPKKPNFALLLTATGERISMGNRGRVDVNITVKGKAVHSSQPEKGLSAINGAWEVMKRIKKMKLPGIHEQLGKRHAIPYQITYSPLAPHTLPEEAFLRIDRRLLPGDKPATVTDELRQAIGDMAPYEVTVKQGNFMWPALVDPEEIGVQRLMDAHTAVHNKMPGTFYGQGTFDAGGPCSAGIPAVMYGVGGGGGVLEADFVPISHVERVAQTVAQTILSYFSE